MSKSVRGDGQANRRVASLVSGDLAWAATPATLRCLNKLSLLMLRRACVRIVAESEAYLTARLDQRTARTGTARQRTTRK